MANLGGRRRFKVNLKRKGAKPQKVVTVARSPEQAKRFAHFRMPGFTATRVTKD